MTQKALVRLEKQRDGVQAELDETEVALEGLRTELGAIRSRIEWLQNEKESLSYYLIKKDRGAEVRTGEISQELDTLETAREETGAEIEQAGERVEQLRQDLHGAVVAIAWRERDEIELRAAQAYLRILTAQDAARQAGDEYDRAREALNVAENDLRSAGEKVAGFAIPPGADDLKRSFVEQRRSQLQALLK